MEGECLQLLQSRQPTSLTLTWQGNEVTRHLNEVFASSDFRPRPLTDAATRKAQSAIIRLVIALSTSSIQAAASSRVLEKLIPFYGGTLSADDAALVDLFQRIEIVSGASVSIAFRSWNPSLDDSPLESSRAASLGLVQSGYVRRAWLRVCASSRTTFPKEHAEITYDPHFLLPFVAHTIAEDELKAADWIAILESGVLAVVVAALGSSSDSTRLIARGALKTALIKLEVRTLHRSLRPVTNLFLAWQALSFREKDEIVLVLTQARNCIYSAAGEAIPSVIALFLANCMHIVGTPESTLYPAFTRFLLQRPILDQRDVPMFYLMFYTTSDEPVEDHRWLLRFLAEGLVRSQVRAACSNVRDQLADTRPACTGLEDLPSSSNLRAARQPSADEQAGSRLAQARSPGEGRHSPSQQAQ